jgi:hypothetical protein
MFPAIRVARPNTFTEWLVSDFWWELDQLTIGPCFAKGRARQLSLLGLRQDHDTWNTSNLCIITGTQTKAKFGVLDSKLHPWEGFGND